jgi:hypothetical protein
MLFSVLSYDQFLSQGTYFFHSFIIIAYIWINTAFLAIRKFNEHCSVKINESLYASNHLHKLAKTSRNYERINFWMKNIIISMTCKKYRYRMSTYDWRHIICVHVHMRKEWKGILFTVHLRSKDILHDTSHWSLLHNKFQ